MGIYVYSQLVHPLHVTINISSWGEGVVGEGAVMGREGILRSKGQLGHWGYMGDL